MQRSYRLMGAAALVVAGLQLAACSPVEEEVALSEPSHVEAVEGSEFSHITLEERAAERIDLQTLPIVEKRMISGPSKGKQRQVIPYGALIYDAEGGAFAYTNPEPLEFVRARLEIDYIESGKVFLKSGPATGTEVVTVGAMELWGAETGVGH